MMTGTEKGFGAHLFRIVYVAPRARAKYAYTFIRHPVSMLVK
jgi:hypothetical protein